MAWLNNTTAAITLKIGSEDYSNNIISIQLTDQSVVNNGAMLTTGTVNLAEAPGESRLEDYAKTKFRRNTLVEIDLTIDGVTKRHPRGHLYILDSTWDPESRAQQIAVGCLLSLFNATDNITELRSLTQFVVPEDAGFSELASSIAAEGKFLWQDGLGDLHKIDFFGDDGLGSNKVAAKWVSVRDYTALSSAPLGGGTPVPDTILMTYSWQQTTDSNDPDDPDSPDGKPMETDTTDSVYWLEHPARLQRKQTVCTAKPDGYGRTCKEVLVNDAKATFSVTKTQESQRRYTGPGGSVGTEISITRGVACEVMGGYYAERYSWELARNNYVDNGIRLKGLNMVIQDRSERTYTYGTGGEVKKVVNKTYKNLIGAMTQNDWRSGLGQTQSGYSPSGPSGGGSRGFLTTIPDDQLYLDTITTTEYFYYDDKTVEETTTLKSSAKCNDVGIYPPTGPRTQQNIDADNNGTEEFSRRTSAGGLLNPDQPPRTGEGGGGTTTRSATYTQESSKYTPTAAGSVTYSGTIPYTSPEWTEARSREITAGYTKHLQAFIEGDAAGIRVAETMRPEIFDYYPGMPFSYYDRQNQKLIKLRMNGTGWAMSATDAVVSTDGIFIGISNGVVDIGSNVPAATGDRATFAFDNYQTPTIGDESIVDQGRPYDVEEYIALDIFLALGSYTGNADDGLGVITDWGTPPEILFNPNDQVYVSGMTVSKEAELLEVDGIGSIPEFGDSILESGDGVLIPDLFDPNLGTRPEKTYFVTLGAPRVNQTFGVTVFVEPPDETFDVEVFAKPADQIFDVMTIGTWQVSVAEPPFIVVVNADPPDQIFMVRASAVPADRSFDVTVGAELPSSTPDGAIFDVTVQRGFEVEVGVAPPDYVLIVTTALAPAKDPDEQFNVSVGGPDAPPVPEPQEILDVRVSYALPDRTFAVSLATEYFVDVANPFPVTVGPETPFEIYDVAVSAPPADVYHQVRVMAEEVPGTNTFQVTTQQNYAVEVSYRPVNYFIGILADDYVVNGLGIENQLNATLLGYVGQVMTLTMQATGHPLWVKSVPENEQGTPVPPYEQEWGIIYSQGVDVGLMKMRFMVAGTYYYASELPGGPIGQIEIRDPFSVDPDFTLDVQVFLEPADEVLQVAALDHIFDVKLPFPGFRVDVLDQVFDVLAITGLSNVTVQENLRVDVLDQVFTVAAVDQLLDVSVAESPFQVAALDESFPVIAVSDVYQVQAVDQLFNITVDE